MSAIKTIETQSKTAPNNQVVRRVEIHEYKRACEALAEAFEADDSSEYLCFCDGRTKEEAAAFDIKIFEYIVYAHLLDGLVLTIGDFESVACWMPPGKNMDQYWSMLRSGMWRLWFMYGAEGRKRFFSDYLPIMRNAKKKVLGEFDDNSWYLIYLGTIPQARGKGHARKLIEHVTRMADKERIPCYLESSNLINRVIYNKYGFDYKTTIYLGKFANPPQKIPLEIMVREPKKTIEESNPPIA
ncbi:hypothetical protein NADFUDRAFT_84257 [Nadsonia fulvescens var. elongata DSM 6958]|uniref:N-acetyltransferase domain-containing protein n=1 Tax=Nadsonia fulvescens var. elongata DSM 6958 TaxID=857566 RepID=A0A1E3PE21_9ASCO|nr:hypothetical protein NADFUDRAFT_84257 [Nadsonia fulvescens var. elongata DSM 6958]